MSLQVLRRSARMRLAILSAGLFLLLGTAVIVIVYAFTAHGASTVVAPVPTHVNRPGLYVRPGALGPHVPLARRLQILSGLNREVVVEQRSSDLGRLLTVSWVVLLITAAVSIPLGWFASGRMLRPLRQITARARTISAGNLHERLALAGGPDEFTELGETLDELLERLQASFDAQRRFVANASHELRTPLTVERTLLQVALADPNASAETLRAACEELLANGFEQERLIEALLTLASSERGLEQSERADLGALATGVLERPRPELDRHGITLEAELEPAMTEGDPALIERLIANLVDNALRHNVDGGHVRVTTRQQGDRALLIVENSGQLISPDEIETMFEPFRRLGPPRTGSESGQHGLGLSIVRAIATAHDAAIEARPRPEGGLAMTVAFPAPGLGPL